MHYVLTEEEYEALQKKITDAQKANKDLIQELCTEVANHKPVKWDWFPDTHPNPDAKEEPWGCILGEGNGCGYCDHCPVQDDCPYEHKGWSK